MKRTQKLVTWGIVILVVLVVLLMLMSNLRRSSRVVLPDTGSAAESDENLPSGGDALTVVEVSPETVQAAVATLRRPESYSRSITVEYLWDGGSGTAGNSAGGNTEGKNQRDGKDDSPFSDIDG